MIRYVINLEKRQDRRLRFKSNNRMLGEYQFLKAFDGKTLSHKDLKAKGLDTNRSWRDPFKNRKMTHGEVGCMLSHWNAWMLCAQQEEPFVIFEDDAIIKDTYDEDEIQKYLDSGYNFIYLQHNENNSESVVEIDDKVVKPSYPYNLTGYVLTPEAAKILTSTDILKQIIPADEYVPSMIGKLNAIAYKEDVVSFDTSTYQSDINPQSNEDYFIDFDVHPITIGTDLKFMHMLNDSAARQGFHLENLGVGVEWDSTPSEKDDNVWLNGPGNWQKLEIISNHIKKLKDDDVVLFVDGYDVFFTRSLEEIVNRYLDFKCELLFSAEKNCWPNQELEDSFPEVNEGESRYLNSGSFIGTVRSLKRVLARYDETKLDYDDQYYFQVEFLTNQHNIQLDVENYVFCTHEPLATIRDKNIYNPITKCYACLYHGNGGYEAKSHLKTLYDAVYPPTGEHFISANMKYDVIGNELLLVDFMTQSQCEDLIALGDKHGGWEPLPGDLFPAQEIRIKELSPKLWEEMDAHWRNEIFPIVEKYWKPLRMFGLRDAFVMRYALDTQTSLNLHNDASMVTGSVKLNDQYEGAELIFPRQKLSNLNVPVGKMILFPGQVTHGHYCDELRSGVKYSLTMWTCRYEGDLN